MLAPVLVELPGGYLVLERGCHARVDIRGPPVEQHLDSLAGAVVPLGSWRLGAGLAGIAAGKGQERGAVERPAATAAGQHDHRAGAGGVDEDGGGEPAGPAGVKADAVFPDP